jgi:toxin-antitoxin system PIN domain toxin
MKKLLDSNVWLALTLSRHKFHRAASDWFNSCTSSGEVIFCRATQLTLLRLLTTSAVLNAYGNLPLTRSEAWQIYEGFCADKRIAHADEPANLAVHWKRLSQTGSASPKTWMDSYLAAFALAGKYQLVTTDKDFTRFDGLNLRFLQNKQ